MEDEIDLRIYIDALLRWWWLIALAALVTGAVAFGVSRLMPPVYEARAGVVTLKSRVEISLGSGFQSVTEDDLSLSAQVQGSSALLDRNKRRLNTLVGMVKNGVIAEQVSAELKDVLTEEEARPGELLANVRGEILSGDSGDSDTIQIIVSYTDPVKAAAIANAWARAFELHVNGVYGEASYSPFADISEQVTAAKVAFDQAQETYITFLGEEDRTAELTRQIEEDEVIIGRLRQGRQNSAATVIEAQTDTQQRVFTTTVASEIDANLTVFEAQKDELLRDFLRAYTQTHRLETLLDDANLMRQQLVFGGDDSARTNGLALLAFKSRVFAASSGLPFETLELTLPSVDALSPESSAAQQLADIDALIEAMEKEYSRLESLIAEQSGALLSGESYRFLDTLSPEYLNVEELASGQALERASDWEGLLPFTALLEAPLSQEIERLEARVQALTAQVAQLQGRKEELQQNRDLAWSAYSNLLSKEQEIAIATTSAGSDVRFAIQAAPPQKPVSPKTLVNTVTGLAIGLMSGVFGAFLFSYLGLESKPRALLRQLVKSS